MESLINCDKVQSQYGNSTNFVFACCVKLFTYNYYGATLHTVFFTGSNEDGVADSTPSCIGHCDCDTVVSTTLQLLYSVAGGGNTTTSPTSISLSSGATTEYSPHHL